MTKFIILSNMSCRQYSIIVFTFSCLLLIFHMVSIRGAIVPLDKYENKEQVRVAFIFAGSSRTFIFPSVKKTIKHNLIKALCPAPSCVHDVFVRVSTSDNNHVGISATGNLTLGSADLRDKIDQSLEIIKPSIIEGGQLHRVFLDIGSKEEKQEMLEFGGDDLKHRIYRELDPRRYSMYFNRWKAYEQMLNHEKNMGKNYTWVVFARLDAGWGAPISSIHTWSPNRIYAPEIWHADVPDTFALLPRQYSDIYFGMDHLMKPKVLCLGGPNLDTATLESSYLRERGYTEYEIKMVNNEDCRAMYPMNDKIKEGKTGLVWSTAGLSEYLLKRRLSQYGFLVQDGNIKLISIFMYILRYPLEPLCLYCKTDFLISWAKINNWPIAGLYPSCFIANIDIKRYEPYQPGKICKPSGIPFPFEKEDQAKVVAQDSCLLREENTDMNFLPFRIRSRQRCLTSTRGVITASLGTDDCINYKRRRFLETYVEEQMFNMYPLIKAPQKIVQYTRFPNEQRLCLTTTTKEQDINQIVTDDDALNMIIPVNLQHCSLYGDLDVLSPQMFTIELLESPRLNRNSVNVASTAIWKPLSLVMLKWQWKNPKTSNIITYCVTAPNGNSTMTLSVRKCEGNREGYSASSKFIQTYVMERVVSSGSPYRPGIMIGKQPAWSDKY